jgi:hypothetical protein
VIAHHAHTITTTIEILFTNLKVPLSEEEVQSKGE